jgi:small GTP-binding protein
MQIIKDEDYDFLYKIVIIGEAGVGKTHLLSKYIKGNLPKNPTSTIGVEFATRTVPLQSGGTVKAQIWDTAGQERYRAITCAHYRRSIGALLVYDITNENSFIACKRWMEELRDHAEPDIVIMLVGNKLDLIESSPGARKVNTEQAMKFAKSNKLMFLETSTFSGLNVKEAFEGLLQAIYQTKSQSSVNKNRDSTASRLLPNISKNNSSSACCS